MDLAITTASRAGGLKCGVPNFYPERGGCGVACVCFARNLSSKPGWMA